MHKWIRIAVLFLSTILFAGCGGGGGDETTPHSSYTGDFLSWTSYDDAEHYFTLARVSGRDGTVTNIGGFDFFTSMIYGPDGTLYGISDELHIIDPRFGATVYIGTFRDASGPILMHGAAFSPDGTLYVVENSIFPRVFTVDLSNAGLTYVGTPTALIWDLEFASDGTLYGGFADLFTLNAADMSASSSIGYTGVYISPLTFGSRGTLFGMDIFPSTHIYSLSLDTGSATPVVAVGSVGLNSLVAERKHSPTTFTKVHKAALLYGYSPPKSRESLLAKEKMIKESRPRSD